MSASEPRSPAHDRSVFAMDVESLETVETIRSLERLIASPHIKSATRVSLHFAIDALRNELA